MITGTSPKMLMRDAYGSPDAAKLKETEQRMNKKAQPIINLAKEYIECATSIDEFLSSDKFEMFKINFNKAKVDLSDFASIIFDMQYISECAIALPPTQKKAKTSDKRYLDLSTDENENYLVFKQNNVNLWQHFIEHLLAFVANKKSIPYKMYDQIRSQALVYLFDNLIYSTHPLHSRFSQSNLKCHSEELLLCEFAKKFKAFITYAPSVQNGLITSIGQKGLVGEKSRMLSLRILDTLETYLCISSYYEETLLNKITALANQFMADLKRNDFKSSSFYKLHKDRFNQLLIEIPRQLKESAEHPLESLDEIEEEIDKVAADISKITLAYEDEDANQNLINDVEHQHQGYMNALTTHKYSQCNEEHQDLLAQMLEEQANLHAKELEELESSLKTQINELTQELNQQRTLTLAQQQSNFEKKLELRRQNAQAEIATLRQKSEDVLEKELKALNINHSQNCEQTRKKYEADCENIRTISSKRKSKLEIELKDKQANLKKYYAEQEEIIKKQQQQEIDTLKQQAKSQREKSQSEHEARLTSLENEHQQKKDSLQKDCKDTLNKLIKENQEKEQRVKQEQQAEYDSIDKAHAEHVLKIENQFQESIVQLEKEHQERKSNSFTEHTNNILELQQRYKRSIQYHVNNLKEMPYRDYLGALSELFKLDEPSIIFYYLYNCNTLHLVIPTLPQNYKMLLESAPLLYNFWLKKITEAKTMSPQQIIALFLLLPIVINKTAYLDDNENCKTCIDVFIAYFENDISAEDMKSLTKSLESIILHQTGLFAAYKIYQYDEISRIASVANQYPINAVYLPAHQGFVNNANLNNDLEKPRQKVYHTNRY